jgi:predicted dehydrogenase
MGTYTCQLATLCFKGLHPVKVIAGGHLNASGADDSSSATILFPKGKTATLITHSRCDMPNEAVVVGTEGVIKVSLSCFLLLLYSTDPKSPVGYM